MKYCSNCGQPMADDARFCSNCGQKEESPINRVKKPEEPAQNEWVYGEDKFENVADSSSTVERKGMRISCIVVAILGIFSMVMAFTDDYSMMAMTAFCLPLAGMFYILSKTPKKSKYLLGAKSGMRKSFFVTFCVVLSFILFMVLIEEYGEPATEQTQQLEEQETADALSAQMEEQYQNAVKLILEENYKDAEKALTKIDFRDADKMLQYVKLMLNLVDYKGEPEKVLQKLDSYEKFENTDVEKQRENVYSIIEQVSIIQKQINEIDGRNIDISSKDFLLSIQQKIDAQDDRYKDLINTEKLTLAVQTIENLEQNNAVGQLIIAIRQIGTVTLDSETQLNDLQARYDSLTKEEKKQVVNYSALINAKTSLDKLKKEKTEAEKKAAQAAAEKAEKEAQEAANAESEKLKAFVGKKCFDVDDDIKNLGYKPTYKAIKTFDDMTSAIEDEKRSNYTDNEWIISDMSEIDANKKTVTYYVSSKWQRENLF